jgi:hypothetical protein
MLVSGSTLRQQQLVIGQAVKHPVPDHYLPPPDAPVPEPIVEGAVNLDGTLAAPVQGTPYAFAYEHSGDEQSSSRSESSDGKKVTGHYTLQGADGIQRIVHYVADFDGFRASIQTNEPGTESHNPSGVLFQSNQLPAAELSRQYVPAAPVEGFSSQAAPAHTFVQPAAHTSFVQPAAAQSFNSQPNNVAFSGQQQQEDDEEEAPIEQQTQQVQQEEVEPAQIKARPLPALAPVPAPAAIAAVKGRPIKIVAQQPTKSILPPPRPVQLPIKAPAPIAIKAKPTPIAAPAPIKGKVIIAQPAPVQAPIKSQPAPAPVAAPAAPVKGRPIIKGIQAPIKNNPVKRPVHQPSFVPRPVPAVLPVPGPAKIVSTTTTSRPIEIAQQPQQQQQQEEDEEPLPQQQQQSFEHDDAHDEGLVEQDF